MSCKVEERNKEEYLVMYTNIQECNGMYRECFNETLLQISPGKYWTVTKCIETYRNVQECRYLCGNVYGHIGLYWKV